MISLPLFVRKVPSCHDASQACLVALASRHRLVCNKHTLFLRTERARQYETVQSNIRKHQAYQNVQDDRFDRPARFFFCRFLSGRCFFGHLFDASWLILFLLDGTLLVFCKVFDILAVWIILFVILRNIYFAQKCEIA